MPFATLSDFFRGLFGPVGNGRENEADDVVRVKTAMRRLGYYDASSYGMTGYIDRGLDDGIRAYQREKGLRADGWMRPDSPTYRRLAADLGTVCPLPDRLAADPEAQGGPGTPHALPSWRTQGRGRLGRRPVRSGSKARRARLQGRFR
jgi:peptidoglycan hydrolase-like protein with peptidoglycan-binding domain